MDESAAPLPLRFEAAVQRHLSVVYRSAGGGWEGHDFLVEVITARQGLDGFEVVVDFRELEPIQGRLLGDLGRAGPLELAQRLAAELAPKVPAPSRLTEVACTDGRGRRLALRL